MNFLEDIYSLIVLLKIYIIYIILQKSLSFRVEPTGVEPI